VSGKSAPRVAARPLEVHHASRSMSSMWSGREVEFPRLPTLRTSTLSSSPLPMAPRARHAGHPQHEIVEPPPISASSGSSFSMAALTSRPLRSAWAVLFGGLGMRAAPVLAGALLVKKVMTSRDACPRTRVRPNRDRTACSGWLREPGPHFDDEGNIEHEVTSIQRQAVA